MAQEMETLVQFHPLAKAVTVKEPVLSKWMSLGGVEGLLGYPVAEGISYRSGAHTMRFQRGYIACHPEHGAHYVSGRLRLWWEDQLGIFGPLGFPVGDPREEGGVTVQRFERGTLRTDMPEIRDGIDLRGEIARRGITIRDQGPRGTCSVQVMVFLLEYLYAGLLGRDFAHLSVEHSNHYANVATGDRDDGHCFHCMEAGYNAYGILPESEWPYDKGWTYDYDQAQAIMTPEKVAIAKRMLEAPLRLEGRFIKPIDGIVGLTDAQFDELLATLDAGIPVGVGRDHSMVAVAYRRDAQMPGGGYILFRNSYGTSPEFTGYQAETFEHVRQTVNDMYVYTYAAQ